MAVTDMEHPLRVALANELHARPFLPAEAPGRALHLAFKTEEGAERDPARDIDHLAKLLERHGAPRPPEDASHYMADLGRIRLKWERHTEFVSYTLFESGASEDLFRARLAEVFNDGWITGAPGQVVAAVECEILTAAGTDDALEMMAGRLGRAFVSESLACSRVLDGAAIACGDFRIHEGGWSRFALIVLDKTGPRRIGRLCQRLLEVETYRTLAMLGLPVARKASARLALVETALRDAIANVAGAETADQVLLDRLTALSGEIESLSADTAYRFGAARAYDAIVRERIEMLKEDELRGRQTFADFFSRRFAPAMRTISDVERRQKALSARAARGAELLRTRVNVALEAQNKELLESMNRRAALQVRLQRTVEGLSVVAVSYYAASLLIYLLGPLAGPLGLGKTELAAGLAALAVLAAWGAVRWRVRRAGAEADAGEGGGGGGGGA